MRAKPPLARHRRTRSPRSAALLAVIGIAVAGTAATGSHTVRSGDTLSELAAKHGVSVAALAEANDIDDVHRVPAGMKLVIPGGDGGKADAKDGGDSDTKRKPDAKDGGGSDTKRKPDAKDGGGSDTKAASGKPDARFHTVAPGETLSAIAARYGVTVRALAEANGLADIHWITAGQRLAIPGSGAGSGDRPPARATSGEVDTSRFPALLQASPERLALVPTFQHWAGVYRVPLDLLMAMTWLESGWQDDVVSSAGAIGIGQLMPDTVAWMRDVIIGEPLDPYDADDNIRMSAAYLRWLLDRTGGDPAMALAGYYQGLGAVRSAGVFPSTRVYVADVLAFRDRHF